MNGVQIVRTDAGWSSRLVASNGREVWRSSEVYERRRSALEAVRILTEWAESDRPVTDIDEREQLGVPEEWRPIPGFDPRYLVSDRGRVRGPRGLLTCRVDRGGYVYVTVARRRRTVHRLVLLAFRGEPGPDQPLVRHLDGYPLNNHLSNLAYGTFSENMWDAVRHGTHARASQTHCKWGHEFTEENVRLRADARGRECRICSRERGRRYKARLRAARAAA